MNWISNKDWSDFIKPPMIFAFNITRYAYYSSTWFPLIKVHVSMGLVAPAILDRDEYFFMTCTNKSLNLAYFIHSHTLLWISNFVLNKGRYFSICRASLAFAPTVVLRKNPLLHRMCTNSKIFANKNKLQRQYEIPNATLE